MSKTTHLERVQAEFIAALQKDGIGHTFEWLHGWFDKVAKAGVDDELERALGPHVDDPQARGLHAMDQVMSLATSISNHSTSASSNLMRQARLAALANVVDYDWGNARAYGSRAERRRLWNEWQARHTPAEPKVGA